ncbi:hypothetical protein ACJJTC_000346, partial [Scirpophaga incertulas]
IEAEAVMLGQAISMLLPKVVGYKLVGELNPLATSTDLVLTITKHLRSLGVVGKFVEFFGPGVAELSIADRATVANMCPEFGATVAYFPVDERSLQYLAQTNRPDDKINVIKEYLKATNQFRDYTNPGQDPVFSEVVELDLAEVVTSVSGPKRPQDRVSVSDMKKDFESCLVNKILVARSLHQLSYHPVTEYKHATRCYDADAPTGIRKPTCSSISLHLNVDSIWSCFSERSTQ